MRPWPWRRMIGTTSRVSSCQPKKLASNCAFSTFTLRSSTAPSARKPRCMKSASSVCRRSAPSHRPRGGECCRDRHSPSGSSRCRLSRERRDPLRAGRWQRHASPFPSARGRNARRCGGAAGDQDRFARCHGRFLYKLLAFPIFVKVTQRDVGDARYSDSNHERRRRSSAGICEGDLQGAL